MIRTITIADVDYDLRPAVGYKQGNPCMYCDLAYSVHCRARYHETGNLPCTGMGSQFYLKKSKMQTA